MWTQQGEGRWDELRGWYWRIYTTTGETDSQRERVAQHREPSSVLPRMVDGGDPGGRGYMYAYSWFTLLYSRSQHNIVKQLCECALRHLSHVPLCATLRTAAHQAPLSRGFSRQEHRSGLPCPPPGDLPKPLGLPHCRRILDHLCHQGSPASLGHCVTPEESWTSQGPCPLP